MYVFLIAGGIVHLHNARRWRFAVDKIGTGLTPPLIECLGSRGRVLATFPVSSLSGWCYDNEEMTHYHMGERTTQFIDKKEFA